MDAELKVIDTEHRMVDVRCYPSGEGASPSLGFIPEMEKD